jgi:magnesium-transporting ATPase (P-type)
VASSSRRQLFLMIVSVTLARGAIRMAKAQVIVKRLGADP